MLRSNLSEICLATDCNIRDAIAAIDRGRVGIALITRADGSLVGTVTDGDVRRAMLDNVSLDSVVTILLDRKSARYRVPVTAPITTERPALLRMMHEHRVHQIPLTDPTDPCERLVGLASLNDLMGEELPLRAVVMAGGFGERLRPLTADIPKPMLPVGDRPLLERTIGNLRDAGIRRVHVTTHYLPEKITDHFGDGAAFGVSLTYVSEERPLGTGGALSLMERPDEPFLVVNGDILTRVDYRAMLNYHREHHASLTVAVREFIMKVPYGVVDSEDGCVRGLREKPEMRFLVNAGIYLLEPAVYEFIERDKRFDMTDLITRLLEEGRTVSSFLIHEYWRDIGKHEDYEQAQEDVKHFDS